MHSTLWHPVVLTLPPPAYSTTASYSLTTSMVLLPPLVHSFHSCTFHIIVNNQFINEILISVGPQSTEHNKKNHSVAFYRPIVLMALMAYAPFPKTQSINHQLLDQNNFCHNPNFILSTVCCAIIGSGLAGTRACVSWSSPDPILALAKGNKFVLGVQEMGWQYRRQ